MAITLNHTIVPAHDKEASAGWFAKIFGLTYEGLAGHFAPVEVDTLTLDFDNSDQFESHHCAFEVSDEDLDAIFDRVKAEDIPYGSGPFEARSGPKEDLREQHHKLSGGSSGVTLRV